ncbi:MAG: hypothetical protein K2X45_08025 [Phreatobacter sp.]|nr:hypothetical protein [Phreatobacter sp.]
MSLKALDAAKSKVIKALGEQDAALDALASSRVTLKKALATLGIVPEAETLGETLPSPSLSPTMNQNLGADARDGTDDMVVDANLPVSGEEGSNTNDTDPTATTPEVVSPSVADPSNTDPSNASPLAATAPAAPPLDPDRMMIGEIAPLPPIGKTRSAAQASLPAAGSAAIDAGATTPPADAAPAVRPRTVIERFRIGHKERRLISAHEALRRARTRKQNSAAARRKAYPTVRKPTLPMPVGEDLIRGLKHAIEQSSLPAFGRRHGVSIDTVLQKAIALNVGPYGADPGDLFSEHRVKIRQAISVQLAVGEGLVRFIPTSADMLRRWIYGSFVNSQAMRKKVLKMLGFSIPDFFFSQIAEEDEFAAQRLLTVFNRKATRMHLQPSRATIGKPKRPIVGCPANWAEILEVYEAFRYSAGYDKTILVFDDNVPMEMIQSLYRSPVDSATLGIDEDYFDNPKTKFWLYEKDMIYGIGPILDLSKCHGPVSYALANMFGRLDLGADLKIASALRAQMNAGQ